VISALFCEHAGHVPPGSKS